MKAHSGSHAATLLKARPYATPMLSQFGHVAQLTASGSNQVLEDAVEDLLCDTPVNTTGNMC